VSDAPRVREIDHVVLRVRDLARSLRFYLDVLGLREERRVERIGLVQLRAGRSLIDLVPVDSPLGRQGGAPPGEGGRNVDHVALRLERLDPATLARHLRAHGAEMGEVEERYGAEGFGLAVYLRDPDGNTIELRGEPGPGAEPR
jgi:catechol 2,3-dioxygenase-like lactoylglutathione lyase family enzyme